METCAFLQFFWRHDLIIQKKHQYDYTYRNEETSCRTIESVADENGVIHPLSGDTGIFIYPGYRFKAVDALITNFHLPESTLLMLVSAFYSREKMLEAYKIAVNENYRFFSFGDAMLIE